MEIKQKLTPFETYIALIKGYCCLSVLLVPKAFTNGGWGLSSIFMVFSGLISLWACNKLVETGLATRIYSYPLVVEKILGKKSRLVLEIAIVLTQFSFAISHVIYLFESLKVTFDSLFDTETNLAIYLVMVLVIYTLLSWVRNLAKFSFTFITGNFLIVATIIFVSVYAGKLL